MSEPFFKESDKEVSFQFHPDERYKGEHWTFIHSPEKPIGPFISLDKANALLKERGTVVYGGSHIISPRTPENIRSWCCEDLGDSAFDTHQALLICIEPIEQPDSADKIVADLAKIDGWPAAYKEAMELSIRARKLKGGG